MHYEVFDRYTYFDMACSLTGVSAVKKYAAIPIKENHKDPFDRALIALCISDDYVFLSHDGKLEQYTQDGLVFIS